jgi:hypothetical protein
MFAIYFKKIEAVVLVDVSGLLSNPVNALTRKARGQRRNGDLRCW